MFTNLKKLLVLIVFALTLAACDDPTPPPNCLTATPEVTETEPAPTDTPSGYPVPTETVSGYPLPTETPEPTATDTGYPIETETPNPYP